MLPNMVAAVLAGAGGVLFHRRGGDFAVRSSSSSSASSRWKVALLGVPAGLRGGTDDDAPGGDGCRGRVGTGAKSMVCAVPGSVAPWLTLSPSVATKPLRLKEALSCVGLSVALVQSVGAQLLEE